MRPGILLALLLTAGSALAQPPQDPAQASAPGLAPSASPSASASASASASPGIVSRRATERVERHIEALRRRLAITPAQKPLWDSFTSVMRDNAAAVEQVHTTNQPRPPGSALEELRSLSIRSRLHADNLARLLPPFEALYNSMSPDQRTLADTTFRQFQRGADAPTRP